MELWSTAPPQEAPLYLVGSQRAFPGPAAPAPLELRTSAYASLYLTCTDQSFLGSPTICDLTIYLTLPEQLALRKDIKQCHSGHVAEYFTLYQAASKAGASGILNTAAFLRLSPGLLTPVHQHTFSLAYTSDPHCLRNPTVLQMWLPL